MRIANMKKGSLLGVVIALALPASMALAHDEGGRDRHGDDDDAPPVTITTTIQACLGRESGHIRIVASAAQCDRHETPITWNVVGPAGAPGAMGPAGPAGATGPAGPIGATGPAGPIGLTGATGATGPIGLTGATGAKGDRGDVGSAGPMGSMGPMGIAGATGPAGAIGPQGAPGAAGPAGPPGANGTNGADGAQGPMGPAGPPGDGPPPPRVLGVLRIAGVEGPGVGAVEKQFPVYEATFGATNSVTVTASGTVVGLPSIADLRVLLDSDAVPTLTGEAVQTRALADVTLALFLPGRSGDIPAVPAAGLPCVEIGLTDAHLASVNVASGPAAQLELLFQASAVGLKAGLFDVANAAIHGGYDSLTHAYSDPTNPLPAFRDFEQQTAPLSAPGSFLVDDTVIQLPFVKTTFTTGVSVALTKGLGGSVVGKPSFKPAVLERRAGFAVVDDFKALVSRTLISPVDVTLQRPGATLRYSFGDSHLTSFAVHASAADGVRESVGWVYNTMKVGAPTSGGASGSGPSFSYDLANGKVP